MPMQLKIVLVDDDPLQLDYMKKMIMQTGDILEIEIIIDQYLSGEAFLFALADHPTWDLAFLDIEMKQLNGMEVARIIREKAPKLELVFATAYAEFAIEGYEVQALDYLLKPITLDNITRVVQRFVEEQPKEPAYVIVEKNGEAIRLDLETILFVEASMGEIKVVLENDTLSLRENLSVFHKKLDERFISPHRSYLVNLQHVSKLLKTDVQLSNNQLIPMSRRSTSEVQKTFINFYKGSVFYDE